MKRSPTGQARPRENGRILSAKNFDLKPLWS